MKSMKRLISMLTVVCMIFSLCSTVGFAADTTAGLVLNDVVISHAKDADQKLIGRTFTVSGTYNGLGADEKKTLVIGLFKGEIEETKDGDGNVTAKEFIDPVTQVVTYVTTSGTFTQDFVIPFNVSTEDDYLGHYMVMVNCVDDNAPQYKFFEMVGLQSTADLTKVSIYNPAEQKEYSAEPVEDGDSKTVTITGVPYMVQLNTSKLFVYTDAFSIQLGETKYTQEDYDTSKGAFVIDSVDCSDPLTLTLFAEDDTSVASYTLTVVKNTPKDKAELYNVKVALKYLKGDNTENWRGFDADFEGGVWHVDVPSSALDFENVVLSYTTDATAVTYDDAPVIKYDESANPTTFDFAAQTDKKITLTLTAEDTSTHEYVIDIDTTAAELKTISLKKGSKTISLDASKKTFVESVSSELGLDDWTVVYTAYDDKKLKQNGTDVDSGVTEFDFSETKTFTLSPDKGESLTYQITLKTDPATVAKLYSVTIGGKVATISGTTISVELPGDRQIAKTNFVYSINDADGATLKFSKNGTSGWQTATWLQSQITNNSASNNLSTYKYLQVVSEDGTVKSDVYALNITQAEADDEGSTTTQRPGSDSSGDTFVVAPTPVVTPDPEVTVNFIDLGTVEWARESINNLAKRGVVSGRSETIFDPDGLVTREEYAKMLVLAFGLTADNAVCDKFWDVSPTDWYYEYVAIAEARGIVNGLGNGSFGVGSTITRQDMAAMTYRAAMATGKAFNYVNEPMTFNDGGDIATYALEAVTVMQRAGIINGMGGNLFAPTGTATRAQAAKIMDMATK